MITVHVKINNVISRKILIFCKLKKEGNLYDVFNIKTLLDFFDADVRRLSPFELKTKYNKNNNKTKKKKLKKTKRTF